MKYAFVIFSISCLILMHFESCSDHESRSNKGCEEIKIKIDDKNGSLLKIKMESVIPLETSQDILIGSVTKAIRFNRHFYILDNFRSKALFVFNEDGKIVKKTVIGKGPGEVIEPFALNINREDSTILLYDQGMNCIHKFDQNGNYIRADKYPNIFVMDFFPISKDTCLVYNADENPNGDERSRIGNTFKPGIESKNQRRKACWLYQWPFQI